MFRSASLDALSAEEAAALRGAGLGRWIDLRNEEEWKPKTLAADALFDDVGVHRPVFGDVDAFWRAVEGPPLVGARLALLWDGAAVDRALARRLEAGGLPALYRATLAASPAVLGEVLRDVGAALEAGDSVVFNCQKGKDRTGVVAALLEQIAGVDRDACIDAYSRSAVLLGDKDDKPAAAAKKGGGVDWGRFRGSPRSAMAETLAWLDARYGGVDGYLARAACLGHDEQRALRRLLLLR